MNASPDLDLAIGTAFQEGRARWPQISLRPDHFSAHVQSMNADHATLARHGADLYLAFACVQRDRSALAVFKERLLPALDRQVIRLGMSASLLDDLHQDLFMYLLCEVPRLRSYRGRASLLRWLSRVATRRAMLLHRHRREVPVDELPDHVCDGGPDPELRVLRRRMGPRVGQALEESLAALSSQQKTLLRRHYAGRQSIDVLAARHRVHRATVARWLAAGRDRLSREFRERLPTTGALDLEVEDLQDELSSILGRFFQEE